jgi:glycosyltransferase involved in cell wall biosynthesis
MIRVIHLLPMLLQKDGPSNGVFNLLKAKQSQVEWAGVWSLRRPPAERDPGGLLAQLGVDGGTFDMRRHFVEPSVVLRLAAKLRAVKPDILQCHLIRANLYGRLAARLANVPVLVNTVHNEEEYFTSGSLEHRMARWAEWRTQSYVSAFVAVSKASQAAYARSMGINQERIRIIYSGVDMSPAGLLQGECRKRLGLPTGVPLIVSVGRLHEQKNYAMLVRCATAMKSLDPSAVFAVAGDGPERNNLLRLVQAAGLEASFKILGRIDDVQVLLASADVFAMSSCYEGLPLVLLEAMARGIPCVATDVGGISEVNISGSACILVPAGDEVGLVRELFRLIRDKSRREMQGRLGQRVAEKWFSSEAMMHAYLELYQSLLLIRQAARASGSTEGAIHANPHVG